MVTRSIHALLLAAPLAALSVGCTSLGIGRAQAPHHAETSDASHTQRMMQLAEMYERRGRHDGAVRLYQQVLKSQPGHEQAWTRMEAIAAMQGPSPTLAVHQEQAVPVTSRSLAASTASAPVAASLPPEERPAVRPAPQAAPRIAPLPAIAQQPVVAAATPPARRPQTRPAPSDSAWWASNETAAQSSDAPAIDVTPASEAASPWSKTSLVRLCETESQQLRALVARLESTEATERKQALIELASLESTAAATYPAVATLLSDDDAHVRAHAAWAVWEIAQAYDESVVPLAEMTQSRDEQLVQVAIYLLGEIGPAAADAAPVLAALRDKGSTPVRIQAAEAMLRMSPADGESVECLIVALNDPDRGNRWLAAVALANVDVEAHPAALEALVAALDDSDAEVCSAAALTLGGFGEAASPAIASLLAVAETGTEAARVAAETALACIVP